MIVFRYSPAAEKGFSTTLLCSLGGHVLIGLLWLILPERQVQLAARPLMVRIIQEVQPLSVATAAPLAFPALTRPRREPRHRAPVTAALPSPPAQQEMPPTIDPAVTDTLATDTAMVAPTSIAAAAGEPPVTLSAANADASPNATMTAVRDAYLQTLHQRIEEHRDYPLLARKGRQQGRAIVRFRLDRQGTLTEAWLATPSGSSLLDRAALRAVTEAAPFPPLPAEVDSATTFDAPVTFRLDR